VSSLLGEEITRGVSNTTADNNMRSSRSVLHAMPFLFYYCGISRADLERYQMPDLQHPTPAQRCCRICPNRYFRTVKAHLSPVYETNTDHSLRYDNLTTRRALERQFPNFRWCVGPNCEYGEEYPEDPKQPMTTCTSCGFEACFYHNTAWHEGMTCDEYTTKAAAGAIKAEKKTEKIIKKIAKRCPGCRRYINKNGGCSHMSCKSYRKFPLHRATR
jgi:hypothetical protein